MSSKIVDPLPAEAFTLSGKKRGPAVPLGRNRYRKSQLMFMHEDELRKANHDMGWPNPEAHAEVAAENEQLAADLAEAQADLDAARERISALESVIGLPTGEELEQAREALVEDQAAADALTGDGDGIDEAEKVEEVEPATGEAGSVSTGGSGGAGGSQGGTSGGSQGGGIRGGLLGRGKSGGGKT